MYVLIGPAFAFVSARRSDNRSTTCATNGGKGGPSKGDQIRSILAAPSTLAEVARKQHRTGGSEDEVCRTRSKGK